MKRKSIDHEKSGNEVHYTNYSTLLIKIMLCSKLDCQKVVNWKSFPIKLLLGVVGCDCGSSLPTPRHPPPRSYMKRELNLNFSENGVYYTNSLVLLVKNLHITGKELDVW